jgi:GNAT superfamily N-acetyltransferase
MMLQVRRIDHGSASEVEAVRALWSDGLLSNMRDPALQYPTGLVVEEEAFVRSTLERGDIADVPRFYGADEGAEGGEGAGQPQAFGAAAMWVALQEGVLVGCVGLRPCSSSGPPKEAAAAAEVCRLGVAARARGCGVARALLEAAATHARTKKVTRLVATTVSLNASALTCYAANGWTEEYRGRKDGKTDEPDFVRVVRTLV